MIVYSRDFSRKAQVAMVVINGYPTVRVSEHGELLVLNFTSFEALEHFQFQVEASREDYMRGQELPPERGLDVRMADARKGKIWPFHGLNPGGRTEKKGGE